MILTELEQFFYDHAGYSYDPKTETKDEGRTRCAKILAVADILAEVRGYTFEWELDPDIDSSDFNDDPEPWSLWQVIAKDRIGNAFGALCGIDFGRDGHPSAAIYSRVVQAEIVSEHVGDPDAGETLYDVSFTFSGVLSVDILAESETQAIERAVEIITPKLARISSIPYVGSVTRRNATVTPR